MELDELIALLQQARFNHGNIRVMVDYCPIVSVDYQDAIPAESEAAFINLSKEVI